MCQKPLVRLRHFLDLCCGLTAPSGGQVLSLLPADNMVFLHRLRPLDVEFMKALHEKVNIVPVLAKADTLTPSEVKKKKIKVGSPRVTASRCSSSKDAELHDVLVPLGSQIREEIEQYGIKIYQFPDCDSDEDEDFKQQDAELKVRPCNPQPPQRLGLRRLWLQGGHGPVLKYA